MAFFNFVKNNNVMKISLTVFFLLMCFGISAQDTYHVQLLDSLNRKYSLPTTVKWVLPNTETTTLANAGNYGGATTNITPTNVLFTTGQQRVVTQGTNPWDAGHTYKNTLAIKKGDKCLIVMWLRSTTPNAQVNIFAENATTYVKEIYAKILTRAFGVVLRNHITIKHLSPFLMANVFL